MTPQPHRVDSLLGGDESGRATLVDGSGCDTRPFGLAAGKLALKDRNESRLTGLGCAVGWNPIFEAQTLSEQITNLRASSMTDVVRAFRRQDCSEASLNVSS